MGFQNTEEFLTVLGIIALYTIWAIFISFLHYLIDTIEVRLDCIYKGLCVSNNYKYNLEKARAGILFFVGLNYVLVFVSVIYLIFKYLIFN